MSILGHEVVNAGRAYLGASFRHHYKPENRCTDGKVTLDSCMEKGLGQNNQFDCSGLIIASICEVLGISATQWPKEYRHANQLMILEEDSRSSVGDIATFRHKRFSSIHLGILSARMTVVHASERTGLVEEGTVLGNFNVRIIPVEKLLELGLEEHANKYNEKTIE